MIESRISLTEKDFNEKRLLINKQSLDVFLIQKAVKTAIQIFYDKGLFDDFHIANKLLKDFLFAE